jgi:hypothetical protein
MKKCLNSREDQNLRQTPLRGGREVNNPQEHKHGREHVTGMPATSISENDDAYDLVCLVCGLGGENNTSGRSARICREIIVQAVNNAEINRSMHCKNLTRPGIHSDSLSPNPALTIAELMLTTEISPHPDTL